MTGVGALHDELRERIDRDGPVGFDVLMELALYDEQRGFFAVQGAAGRRGDFLTSAEVGPLFGAVLARALDTWWRELGEPDPFTMIEVGAGVGTLWRAIAAAAPACASALWPVLVERSARLREAQPDGVVSRADLPDAPVTGVVVANELLDNLPFAVYERTATGWDEVRVDIGGDGELQEVVVTGDPEAAVVLERLAPAAEVGRRVPWQAAARAWIAEAKAVLERGRVVVLDYGAPTATLADRDGWLRTYRGHGRGTGPLDELGVQDITADVAWDQLPPGARRTTQGAFLEEHGIAELVAEGRRVWHERAHVGDLAAMKARSRVREAEALLDPEGLGGFGVLEWPVDAP